MDLAGGSWKHALHKREGQGYLKLAIFTSLPPICELLATCVMKSTFNHKKRTDKYRHRFPELTHSVLHFSTTRLCLSCIYTQAIHTNMVKSYKKKSKQYVKVQSFQYLGVLYLQEKWWWHLLPNKLFLIGHQSTNANSHQITYNKQINQSIFIDWSGLNHDVVTPYRSI